MDLRLLVVVDHQSLAAVALADTLASTLTPLSWTVDVCRVDRGADPTAVRLLAATRRILTGTMGRVRPVVLFIGPESCQRRWMWALVAAGLRSGVRVALHVGASRVPLDLALADPFRLADLIGTDSDFGARAVLQCCRDGRVEAGGPVVSIPSLLLVASAPGDDRADRDAFRSATFDLGPDHLLIASAADATPACWLALAIFAAFADGLYWQCHRCGRVAAFPRDHVLAPVPVHSCGACGSTDGHRGRARPEARLFVAGSAAHIAPGEAHDTWTAREALEHLGLEGRVFREGDGRTPSAAFTTTVRRLAVADIHIAPHPLADVQPAVLASAALGVPTVATRFGAAVEVLAEAARLVPPALTQTASSGHHVAIMDTGQAVRELLVLADDAPARRAQGERARLAMRRSEPSAVACRWHDHLQRLALA